MELQNKFEKIISSTRYHTMPLEKILIQNIEVAKQCTILCLEEQEKLLARLGSKELNLKTIFDELSIIQNQLKLLKN